MKKYNLDVFISEF